ncbi:hypothetical protein ACP70R_000482 [Stipagrostis hirtigluma subsp. patula]
MAPSPFRAVSLKAHGLLVFIQAMALICVVVIHLRRPAMFLIPFFREEKPPIAPSTCEMLHPAVPQELIDEKCFSLPAANTSVLDEAKS